MYKKKSKIKLKLQTTKKQIHFCFQVGFCPEKGGNRAGFSRNESEYSRRGIYPDQSSASWESQLREFRASAFFHCLVRKLTVDQNGGSVRSSFFFHVARTLSFPPIELVPFMPPSSTLSAWRRRRKSNLLTRANHYAWCVCSSHLTVISTQRHQQYPRCPSWLFILERYKFCVTDIWDKKTNIA